MLNIAKVLKPWKEAGALNAQIALYGYWNDTTVVTKSGALLKGIRISGVDYQSLDSDQRQYAVRRLESALKGFGEGFRVLQYLFKSNRPHIPFAKYNDPVIDAAVDQRRQYFEAKREDMYEVEIFYVIVYEGQQSKTGLVEALKRMTSDFEGGWRELKAQFAGDQMKVLLRKQIDADERTLEIHVRNFVRSLSDFMQLTILDQHAQFTFFRRLLNFDPWRIAGKPLHTQFLDYQVVNSDIEAERDHLRIGDHFVRLLTMKEAIAETRPMVLDRLFKINANFHVVTEWVPLSTAKARKEIVTRRRHFNVAKTGFFSQLRDEKKLERDQLIDESKQADVEQLGQCLRVMGDGQTLGEYSLTIVVNSADLEVINRQIGEFSSLFTNADGSLFTETYNQLNALFATIPGNHVHNLRRMFMTTSNYADLSFLFTIHAGELTNPHLGTEYLAVLETDNSTPYFLNLHNARSRTP